ncbi:DUF226 domain-containing protein (plasmid) [Borrelia coriaceae]|uniref:Putative cytosolic protein n=1 Tax=Borrelia coriaceae ATCC 43381 TaxID=1408429 RepID=W5SX52_9SPIR|nr:DUF226 domain-containing protein [Borrelia coriaceae]AHH11769.1 Putative cytosolic protein [Borrelia coriaceae ATCC 43381]UPA16694.1 DUF226 domain-containing protein [Borrelia coriaceae]
MNDILERLKEKKLEVEEKTGKCLFVKVEKKNNRTLYHTKIMLNLYAFGIKKNQKSKFFISFRKIFDQQKMESFSLFSLKEDDEFLGIHYGRRKPIKNLVRRYEENGVMKASTYSRACYIEFRFKKGSVFCYLVGISYLLRKEKSHKKYYTSLIQRISDLETQVYEFYGKKLPNGGHITKWIKKNAK